MFSQYKNENEQQSIHNYYCREEIDIARATKASMRHTPAPVQEPINVESAQDFPSLSGESAKPASQTSSSPAPQRKSAAKMMAGIVMVDDDEEFPGLSGQAVAKPSTEPAPSAASMASNTAKVSWE